LTAELEISNLSTRQDQRSEIIYTERVADAIIELAIDVEDASKFEIVLSEPSARNDDYSDAVKAVNKRLKQFCQQNNWKLISHANITSDHLTKVACTLIWKVTSYHKRTL